MAALRGVGVLVTRPALQAGPLCTLLEASGAFVVRFPAIAIEPTAGANSPIASFSPAVNFDLVVFTSANAVRFGSGLLQRAPPPQLAAIGPATARALEESGHRVAVLPLEGSDSESLLRQPPFARLDGKRVLIVKGTQGRDLLQDELARRGAQVSVAHVYRRVPVLHTATTLAALETQLAQRLLHVITATSAEIAAALVEKSTPDLRRDFEHLQWLVPGSRVAAAVRALGIMAPIVEADSALDQDLVSAIVRWRAGESGA
jgi:uroporphyrinogen-III synthase